MKMRYTLPLLILPLLMTATAFAQTPTPTLTSTPEVEPSPRALVSLTGHDPWAAVLGADSPTFTLYDDGLVIYINYDDPDPHYQSVQLSPEELEEFQAGLDIGEAFFALDEYYPLTTTTDQPTYSIYVWDETLGSHLVWVYGYPYSPESSRNAPEAFMHIYDQLVSFQDEEAEPWFPEQFEVILWEYNTSEATEWPADWPSLDDPTTIQRSSVYSLYLDASEYETFIELAQTANAFELDGQTWAFSMRLPFVDESAWLGQ